MPVKFYNPGTKIDDTLRYDNPTSDPKYQNNIAYFQLHADAHSFFDVPTEQIVITDNGELVVPVRFADRVRMDYRDYGCIRINPRLKAEDINEDDNVAVNEKDAKEKGDRLWKDYLLAKAREHILNCDQARAAGGVPMRAKGVYAHALKSLGMQDPADAVGTAVERSQTDANTAELQRQIKELSDQVANLAKRKN